MDKRCATISIRSRQTAGERRVLRWISKNPKVLRYFINETRVYFRRRGKISVPMSGISENTLKRSSDLHEEERALDR